MKLNLILIVLLSIGCTTKRAFVFNEHDFGDLKHGYPKKTQVDTIFYSDGSIKGIGQFAIDSQGQISNYKTGTWTEYNSNGSLKGIGGYKMGEYVNCCMGGPCTQFYHYKIGEWQYFDEHGKLSYEVKYEPKSLHIDTSCEGGDNLTYGLIEEKNVIVDSVRHQLNTIEIEEQDGYLIMFPSESEDKIALEWKNKHVP
ncbi:hypothetical protein OKW21_004504 [Catalinimonas alkaloidigena]|uniref:toxin-antitoxin system YwqK family antitoxin n=1 Tax=Catalinimonas alkaloidigena TaxID=1075417 RepID=UPI0024070B6A|nr:hypothetical protein [Catalinimonas alkaloidigena]MDF9799241.1 hypothetical protein [Catalinimonas alkaloidigena]